jgi:hypothetical protein
LEGCAVNDDLPNEALLALVTLYEKGEYAASDQRITELMLELLRRDALTGNEDAIFSLAGVYGNGEPLLSIPVNKDKERCLLDVAESAAPFDHGVLLRCLEMP